MRFLFLIIFMSSFNVCAQALQQLDSLVANKLEEVVITGQINPQSISNSIVEVKVITREDIERQAGDTTISKKLILN